MNSAPLPNGTPGGNGSFAQGGAVGNSGHVNGYDGNTAASTNLIGPGGGGGGGGWWNNGTAGSGGNGGFPGGGGAGGGAYYTSGYNGNGGNGAAGATWIVTNFS